MTTSAQSVIKKISHVIKKVPQKISFHVALLITSTERKNYAAMARSNGISYSQAYVRKENLDELLSESIEFLHSTIKNRSTRSNPGYLIIDFTMLIKQFSKHIPNVTYDRDGVSKRVEKGFSLAFMFWSDGTVMIPFDFTAWLSKKDAGELYKKKTEIIKELAKIAQKNGIPFKEVRLDGAFASEDLIKFLLDEGIHFTIKMPCNRVVDSKYGSFQLINHPQLKMSRNQKYKTIQALYKGLKLYFTAEKRKGKKGKKEVVFIVSDLIRTPKEHAKAYKKRWPCEKYFRTGKQSIGLSHCQSTNYGKQKFHIFAVMIAFTILHLIQIDQKKKSVEEVLKVVRFQKQWSILSNYIDLEATFMN